MWIYVYFFTVVSLECAIDKMFDRPEIECLKSNCIHLYVSLANSYLLSNTYYYLIKDAIYILIKMMVIKNVFNLR